MNYLTPNQANTSISEALNQTTTQPTTTSTFNFLLGLGFAMLAAFLVASSTILIKKLNNSKVHFAVNIIYPAYLGMPITLVISLAIYFLGVGGERPAELYEDSWTLLWQCVAVIGSAMASFLTQLVLIIGLKYEDPAKFSIIRTTDVLFSFVLQTLVLGIYANYLSILGALLIFLATLFVILFKIMDQRNSKSKKPETACKKCVFFKM